MATYDPKNKPIEPSTCPFKIGDKIQINLRFCKAIEIYTVCSTRRDGQKWYIELAEHITLGWQTADNFILYEPKKIIKQYAENPQNNTKQFLQLVRRTVFEIGY